MPSAEYEMNYGAATYNPNASHATMATNKDQQPLQQELQTYFCDNTELLRKCETLFFHYVKHLSYMNFIIKSRTMQQQCHLPI
ncbi:hypothetical protein T4D_9863 [Trichinella pseudospiralis]|uniref:Uncharacterized protein n=1 Tax=Trichinella pseudospiralis TaxID=6337 RepID=A0A0V1DNQ2_TRIPS|nr:hypothetical protein T4D_9863 [Trichinella pseudospiralis]